MIRYKKQKKTTNRKSKSGIELSKYDVHLKKISIYKIKHKKNIIPKNKLSNKDAKSKSAIILNDYELNVLSYENAIKIDKRSFRAYYISLIKRKHPFIFHFCPMNDFNSPIIKICLFFLCFSIYYFINSLFFDESMIHQIYEDGGIYNFIYLIPFITFSFLISHLLSIILRYVFLSERNIYELKKAKTSKKLEDLKDKIIKFITIKCICFFSISIVFLFFLWYYLSSFGAVYQNSQLHLFINTLISFSLSLIFPFIINILPSCLRIYSLSNKNRKCIYKANSFFQLI